MECFRKDCNNYYKGHICFGCWRNKGLHDYYQPSSSYTQGRIANMLGQVWEEYVLSGLTKKHAARILFYIQMLQTLIFDEELQK